MFLDTEKNRLDMSMYGFDSKNSYEFRCTYCRSEVYYDITFIENMKSDFGATWWTCPVCGCKNYFKEIYNKALRKRKAPRVALP